MLEDEKDLIIIEMKFRNAEARAKEINKEFDESHKEFGYSIDIPEDKSIGLSEYYERFSRAAEIISGGSGYDYYEDDLFYCSDICIGSEELKKIQRDFNFRITKFTRNYCEKLMENDDKI